MARAIHDRYHASRRNPWNEVECGDHYARSMASYGVFLAACGYEYHGPKRHLGFAPLKPGRFPRPVHHRRRLGHVLPEGGIRTEGYNRCQMGQIAACAPFAFAVTESVKPTKVQVALQGGDLACRHSTRGGRLLITLAADVVVEAGQALEISIG